MDFLIEPFTITVSINSNSYIFSAGQTYLSENKEVFTLMHKNRIIEIQSDRPFIRRQKNGKKKIDWKVINGQIQHKGSLEIIMQELASHIKRIENPPFDWKTHPKNQPY